MAERVLVTIHDVLWWARWFVRCLPACAYRRLTQCRKRHVGPIYDGYLMCLNCGAPWFSKAPLYRPAPGHLEMIAAMFPATTGDEETT